MNKRFSKFMLTSASALALLAAYPSVASTAEVVGFDLPAITAEAATQGDAFIRVVRALPSVANITSADASSVRAARNLYNSLPNAEKANADVTRWAGYLADKEAALPVDHVRNFLLESRVLPNVAEINAMNATEFAQAKVDLQAARASYAQLTDAEKANADVARWAGYLTVKEDAFGVTFILAAKDLPSMDAIGEMDAEELVAVQEDIDSVRELYDALSDVAKADKEVARWIGYVDQKEEAVEEASVVELSEVTILDSKTLAVKFNRPVEKTQDAKFAIKKGASSLSAEGTWNADKTELHLELAGKITAGKYDVTITGLTEDALVGSVEATNERVEDIKVLTTDAPLSGTSVNVSYQLLNQYGEDVTKTSLGNNLTVTAAPGTAGTIKDGVFTVNEVKLDTKFTVVIVDQNTGKSASGQINVVNTAVLDTIQLGDVYQPKDLPLNEDNKAEQYVLVSGLDQYGKDVKLTTDNMTVVSSNQGVATFTLTDVVVNEETVQALQINVNKAGTTTLTVVSNSSGKSATKNITVAPGVKVDTISIGNATGTVSGSKKITLPVEITNNRGELITKKADAGKITLNSTDSNKPVFVEKDGALFIELTTPSVTTAEAQKTVVVTATTETNKVVTKVLTVRPNAVATELVGIDNSVSFNILAGRTLDIPFTKFIVNDQYGDRVESGYTISVDGLADENTITATADGDSVSIATEAASKNETVRFTLVGKESSLDQRVTIVKASEFASYKIEDVDVIYAAKSDNGFVVAEGYNKELVVKATTDAGRVVTLTEGTDYTVLNKPGVSDAVRFAENATQAKVTATVVINATGETLTKELTYSNVAPKAVNVVLTEDVSEGLDKVKAFDGTLEFTGSIDLASVATELTAVTTDQYGVKGIEAISSLTFRPSNVDEVAINNNGTKDATVSLRGETKESTLTVTVKVGNLTKDIAVKLSAVTP